LPKELPFVIKTHISKEDLISVEEFAKVRTQQRKNIGEIKKNRRATLGAEATLYFENFDTLWWQIQEMLFIEKGGEAQVEDELLAYNPLMPQGQELVATFMIPFAVRCVLTNWVELSSAWFYVLQDTQLRQLQKRTLTGQQSREKPLRYTLFVGVSHNGKSQIFPSLSRMLLLK
jgi:hypothetical protein